MKSFKSGQGLLCVKQERGAIGRKNWELSPHEECEFMSNLGVSKLFSELNGAEISGENQTERTAFVVSSYAERARIFALE